MKDGDLVDRNCKSGERIQHEGGPAFPNLVEVSHGWEGMTLRDYFAGQVIAGESTGWTRDGLDVQELAERAYAVADAMIAERSK